MFVKCKACVLYKTSPQVGPDGDPDSRFVIIPEAPGEKEILSGRPLDGPAGKLFDELLLEAGMERAEAFIINSTLCLPPKRSGSRTPTDDEAAFCTARHAMKYVKEIKPIITVLLGATALKAVLGNASPMGKVRGKFLDSPWGPGFVMPTWHPSYFLRSGNPNVRKELLDDLTLAVTRYRENLGSKEFAAKRAELAEGAKIEDKAEMIRNLERRPVEGENYWRPERKYFAGWTDGEDVVMVWRDPANERKRLERIGEESFRWYFYIRTQDVQHIPSDVLDKWKRRGTFYRLETETAHPQWTRVYGKRFITQTQYIKERGEIGVTITAKALGKYEKEKDLADFIKELELLSVKSFEADLTPRQRFMTEYDVKIEDIFRELYFDLETDDRQSGFTDLESRRILSIGFRHLNLERKAYDDCYVLAEDKNGAEEDMLLRFKRQIEMSEILYAWNGFNFDFPIIRARMKKYGIDIDWRLIVWCDLLSVWRRYFQRAAAVNVSFSLGDIGERVLHKPKLDWRAEAAKLCKEKHCHPDPPRKMYDLWRMHPEILQEYNERDVDILEQLEKAHGFAKIDQTFCRVGNCLPADFHISTKIDMLMLKKGFIDGIHFKTRIPAHDQEKEIYDHTGKKKGADSTYEGAFVFEPKKGIHEDVAALDFKSLYPSMMVTFNISPETYVHETERHLYDPKDLITTPIGTTFKKNQEGFIPQIFNETLQKRKVYQELQLGEVIGSDKFLLYYRLSYAFKRLGLSFYGEIGNSDGRYFNPSVAASVTLSGQHFIKETAKLAEHEGLDVLYGDTDSVYIKMPQERAIAFCKATDAHYREMVKQFNIGDKWIVELEYENHFKRIFFVSKKRYAGLMHYFKGKPADYLEVKGLEFMRSDGPQYGRQMQHDVMDIILRQAPDPIVLKRLLLERVKKVMSRTLPAEDVRMTQSIEKDVEQYKTAPPHVRIAKHIKEVARTEYYVGMKVPYIMLDEKAKAVIWEQEYDPTKKTYDPFHFWNKKVYPATKRVLDVVFPNEDWDKFFV